MYFIDLATQYQRYKNEINLRMQQVLDHGQYIMGPEVFELEQILAEYVGVKYGISTSNGTHSLEIALRAWNIGAGDEVITVPFSWISSAEVISLVGATPVFVDIDPKTYLMDATKLEAAISERTKAIMPVSLFGQIPDMSSIAQIAEKYAIPVLEDAAQSFGATQNGKKSCGITHAGSTSFFPAKPFGCYGDGGALFTNDDELAETMRAIRTHGGVARHHHTHVGTNGRFDTLQAAVLLAKWPYFQEEVEARARIGKRYNELLADVCTTPLTEDGNTHVYAQYTIRVPKEQRDAIQASLKEKGIPTGVYYPKCFHEQPVYANLGYQWGDFPESEKASREVLSLPMHPFLTEEEQDQICQTLRKTLTQNEKQKN